MRKLLLLIYLLIPFLLFGQKISSRLNFEQGQLLEISLQLNSVIAQQAMGQAIDFTVDATGDHSYRVTNATADNSTLNHQVNRIVFSFDGMGQKRNFDSNIEKDMNGPFGKPVKEILDKKYDMIVDSGGRALVTLPEKIELTPGDSRMAIITNMLRDVFDLVQPPQRGTASFFKVLPDSGCIKGQTWTESYINDRGKFDAAYKVSDITDSTVVIDYAANSVTVSKAEMMGNETTTTMNNKSTGRILLDRQSGILIEKTINTESNGNTEASFGTLPVTSKTTTVIRVKRPGR
jgi:hypothetical protein